MNLPLAQILKLGLKLTFIPVLALTIAFIHFIAGYKIILPLIETDIVTHHNPKLKPSLKPKTKHFFS